jgi:hypothetical protein
MNINVRLAMALCVTLSACSPARVVVSSPPAGSELRASAETELRAGCLDCLRVAVRQYEAIGDVAGVVRAASMIALRERELGMADGGDLDRAQALITSALPPPSVVAALPDIVDALPPLRGGVPAFSVSDAERTRARTLRQRRDGWAATLRGAAGEDPAAAYVWVALACDTFDARTVRLADIAEPASALADVPLVKYRQALCGSVDGSTLAQLFAADPRFVETTYSMGLAALGQRPPQLDEADRVFRIAYAWHPRWPSLTLVMGGVALTGEEFERAHTLYQETLAMRPHLGEAMLGDVRTLTYMNASERAIAMTDSMLAEGWDVGDARYWRAYNELTLARLDAAWADIEEAQKALVNAAVPKLAGRIAYRRGNLSVAAARLRTSYERDASDCETQFYLGAVYAETRDPLASDTLISSVSCFDDANRDLRSAIDQLTASDQPRDRAVRQVAGRERQIAENNRLRAQADDLLARLRLQR